MALAEMLAMGTSMIATRARFPCSPGGPLRSLSIQLPEHDPRCTGSGGVFPGRHEIVGGYARARLEADEPDERVRFEESCDFGHLDPPRSSDAVSLGSSLDVARPPLGVQATAG